MPPKTRSKNPAGAPVDNPQPKMCGGQKSILATEHNDNIPTNSQSTEEPPAQQQSKKRSAAIQGNVEDAPPVKKGKTVKGAAATSDPLADKPAPSRQATRPTRGGKSTLAISNDQDVPKRRRRTKEEVAAEKEKIAANKEAKRQAAEEAIRKAEMAKACLAQLDIDEERADSRMEDENPRRLSGVKRKRGGAKVEESEGESFGEVPPCSEDAESEVEIIVGIPGLNTVCSPANIPKGEEGCDNKEAEKGSTWRCRYHCQQVTL